MKTLICLVPALLLCGCAGSHCRLTARSVESPISCTPCVLDSAGRLHKTKASEVVSHFTLTRNNTSMFWKLIPLNQKEWDLSQELNAKLQASAGNAVVNLTVHASGSNFLDWYFASLVPLIPSYVSMKVEGDIVRIPEAQP